MESLHRVDSARLHSPTQPDLTSGGRCSSGAAETFLQYPASPTSVSPDKFLLVKGVGGMGNRMQSALGAIWYARLTRRKLLVDWSDYYYSADGSNVFPRFFQCPAASRSDDIPVTDSVRPAIWRGHLRDSVYDMRRRYGAGTALNWPNFSVDLTTCDDQEEVIVMWTYNHQIELLRKNFAGAFNRLTEDSTEAIVRKMLQNDLLLHPSIRERVDEFKARCFLGKIVGVHVRYTDQRSRVWTILKTLNALLKHEPDLRIFLATDNRQITRLFEESYRGVIATPHWYSAVHGLAIHRHPERTAPMESGIEALVDLYLLADSNYLIVDSSSSFSYLAKLLTKAPDAHVQDVGHRDPPAPARRRFVTRVMLKWGLYSWGLRVLGKLARIQRRFTQ